MRDVMIPNWLKELPLAPEFRPTDTEFADPIAYISKIEKEASAFGICKVIPPFPRPSKKYVFANLNKSLSKCPELGSDVNVSNACSVQKLDNEDKENNVGEVKAVFTTRQQELGQNEKRAKGVQKNQKQASGIHKQVWQSGEIYTLEEFESKSKIFARSQLGMIKEVSPYVIEALFWKAASEKPIYVEYANDVPGSGFGEPEELPRYFRRSRRRTYSRKSQGSPESKKVQEDHISQLSSQKSGPSNNEISNSPWNLQVIARSPGSLTRFMPDDIPGVTSPMVYIGMLFSWFAWHVEDHELHSLNFLHTGSAKTWYAVPGDYAFTFEELIRTRAYGGNIDRLAALILLGEKTTLLSPEVIVASGIPCCRLVQNPGEFVVTFPRAYHVGFSHGFNCGEAANFGTPKWLTVAKEAAVRRAAMNHLPMLSHQQLLYLLTMSFISRVPRSLLPGVRNSRLRDRQKEEREILVKKAFIEDILKENNLLTYLLQQNSTYRAVLWDLESLPSSSIKESDMGPRLAVTTTQIENVNTETDDKGKLFDQSLCVESLNDYADADDDLSSDFQVDSGALPCVACGLLGFPFMCVLQPSKEASMEIMSANHDMVQDRGIVDPAVCNSGLFLDGMAKVSVSDVKSFSSSADDDLKSSSKIVQFPNGINSTHTTSPSDIPGPDLFVPNDPLISSGTKLAESSNNYLRPRIFCLEHAIEVEVLLHSKGGADVLVICHSDFQKIKAQAAAVAEEIRSPFKYQEIPLNNASLDDLNLVNFAIDDEEQGDECGEDWTTKVKINLRNCVKLRKKFPTEKLQHALTLNGLFFDTDLNASSLSFNWQFKKFRSKRRKINHRDQIENDETLVANSDLQVATSESAPIKKDESLGPKLDVQMGEKQVELIHYFRKRFKSKNSGSLGESKAGGDTKKLLEPVGCAGVTSLGSFDEQMVSGGEDGQFLRDKREFNEASTVSAVLMETCAAEKMDTGSQDGQSLRDKGKLNESSPVSAEEIVDVPRETCNAEKVDSSGENESSLCHKRELNESSRVSAEEIVEIRICAVEETDTSGEHGSYLQDERDFNESCPVSAEEIVEVPTADKIDTRAADGQSLQHKRELNESSRVSTQEIVEVPIEICAAKKMDSGGEDGQSLRDKIELKESSSVSADGTVEVPTETCAALKVDSSSENGQSLRDKNELNESSSVSAKEIIEVPTKTCAAEKMGSSGEDGPSLWDKRELDECGPDSAEKMYSNRENGQSLRDNRELNNCSPDYAERMDSHGKTGQSLPEKREFDGSNPEIQPESVARNARKRKREADVLAEGGAVSNGFIRSPCEGLRPRGRKDTKTKVEENPDIKKSKNSQDGQTFGQNKKENRRSSYKCNIEGCQMRFQTKEELLLHKRNRCPYEGCGKKFSSHKNAVTHARVHNDDRPLKCTWAGCTKSFKWAWARTEHIRVHTGEKPYKCKVDGCGLTFRFVSDFSRHKRKTGHSAD